MTSSRLRAQGVCDQGNGPLNPAFPTAISPGGIIQEFARKEAAFKAARDRYGYTLDITVQTLNSSGEVDGEFHQVSEMNFSETGKRVEKMTFAPESTLRRLYVSQDDLDDIYVRLPFAFTPEKLRHFTITYAGRQRVDELNTYVFNVSPVNAKKDKKLFAGRIWVDDLDLMIVKTCGRAREEETADTTKKGIFIGLTPVFVTYRELIAGQFWFTTYARADEIIRFPRNFVHLREVVKYSNYKPLAPK